MISGGAIEQSTLINLYFKSEIRIKTNEKQTLKAPSSVIHFMFNFMTFEMKVYYVIKC